MTNETVPVISICTVVDCASISLTLSFCFSVLALYMLVLLLQISTQRNLSVRIVATAKVLPLATFNCHL